LHENGIQTSVHYPAVHRLSIYKQFSNKLPITEYVANNEVTLPMYSKLKSSHLKQIYSAIIQYEK
jgi:dTDP-4-amino-4,6-dideoxygalactose transaminase